MKKTLDIETLLTTEELGPYGSINIPVYLSSTFGFKQVQDAADAFAGKTQEHIYGRISNPTTDAFEEKMAEIEGGHKGLAFASGMAAIHAVIMSFCEPGDRILCVEEVYGGTHELLKTYIDDLNIEVTTFKPDLSDFPTSYAKTQRTSLIFAESPTNPSLHTIDFKNLWDRIYETYWDSIRGFQRPMVCVDNTFATPIVQTPVKDNYADMTLYSCTKYVCGHGDLIGGAVVCGNDVIYEKIKHTRTVSGGIMSPFVAYLCLRGLKTMGLRMERHYRNATRLNKLFKYYKFKDVIKKIYYPGFGGMISIDLGTREKASELVSHLEIPVIAVSLGETRTLINIPACMTHSTYSEEELKAINLSPGLIRISTGIENTLDLEHDFEQALQKIGGTR